MTEPLSPDLSSLADLAHSGSGDVLPLVLRAQAELFASAYALPRDDIEAFEALATALAPKVDTETAIAVARRLAPHPDVPPAVLAALGHRHEEAMRAVLAAARRVDPAWVEEALAGASAGLAAAVAGRPDLGPDQARRLLARDEPEVDEALARNPALVLPRPDADRLLARARSRPALAAALIDRRDLTGLDKAGLFAHATREQRAAILAEVEGFVALAGRRRVTAFLDAALRDRAIGAAARADRRSFAEVLADSLGVAPGEGLVLCEDPLGDLVALSLVAAGVEEEDAIRIFLTLDPTIARSVERVFALAGLVRGTSREAARRIVMAVLDRERLPARRRALHVPALSPTGTGARPGPARDGAAGPAQGERETKRGP